MPIGLSMLGDILRDAWRESLDASPEAKAKRAKAAAEGERHRAIQRARYDALSPQERDAEDAYSASMLGGHACGIGDELRERRLRKLLGMEKFP